VPYKYSGSISAFKVLYARDPNILNNEHEGRRLRSQYLKASQEYLTFLLLEGVDPKIGLDVTISPPAWAAVRYDSAVASQGKVEAVKYLLEQGADPSDGGIGPFLFCALHSSVEKGHREIVKLLLEHGADPRVEDGKGHDHRQFEQGRRRNNSPAQGKQHSSSPENMSRDEVHQMYRPAHWFQELEVYNQNALSI